MLRIGGAETLSLPLLSATPPTPLLKPPQREFLSTAVTKNDRTASSVIKKSSTTSSTFHQSTAGHTSSSDQLHPPPSMSQSQTTYIVGPVIYMYFTTANNSDARFTVDLLFQHPSYFKASLCFILYDSDT